MTITNFLNLLIGIAVIVSAINMGKEDRESGGFALILMIAGVGLVIMAIILIAHY